MYALFPTGFSQLTHKYSTWKTPNLWYKSTIRFSVRLCTTSLTAWRDIRRGFFESFWYPTVFMTRLSIHSVSKLNIIFHIHIWMKCQIENSKNYQLSKFPTKMVHRYIKHFQENRKFTQGTPCIFIS